jgi:hypothetical protein
MSVYEQFFIFVEGEKDRLFFSGVVEPIFLEKCDCVQVIEWASKESDWVNNYIRSIKSDRWNADYIFVTDMDTPCVTARKEEIQKRFRGIDDDKIMVVKKEIESWYLAVLDDNKCRDFEIPSFRDTEGVTKEQFNGLVPARFDSDIDFMQQILNSFEIETAKQKNGSFRYFAEKYGL